MPHSGGGGSHSGGGHHGGSHHSSSGSSGGSSRRVSNTPFEGSHTYVVYNKHGGSRIVYSDDKNYHAEMTKKEMIGQVLFGGIFALVGVIELIAIICILISGFRMGVRKTNIPDYVDQSVQVYDELDFITQAEETSLRKSLEEFRDKTGIIPAIEFTVDDAWSNDYLDMENFAYNEYVCNFTDEYHLLIIYSFGYVNNATGFHEFHWESMWGDNLSKTASTSDENYLADTIQENLTRANGKGVSNAIGQSFDTFFERLNRKGYYLETEMIFVCLFMLVHGGIFAAAGIAVSIEPIKKYKTSKEQGEETYKIDGTPVVLDCEYCKTPYYKGTIGNCKNCGAPLSVGEMHIY